MCGMLLAAGLLAAGTTAGQTRVLFYSDTEDYTCDYSNDGIRDLAPGDFRTVRQGLYYLGETVGNAERLSGLEHESTVKSKGCNGIGFSPAA